MKKLLRQFVVFRRHGFKEVMEFVGEVAFVVMTIATVYIAIRIAYCE